MSWLSEARVRLLQLVRRDEAERRMSEEIDFHLEMETQRLIRLGLPPEEARRRALVAFGGVERHKEELRHGRGIPLLEELWRDLHYAVRALRKSPAFTIAAVLTLALGVGANTAVFGLVSASLLRPLPFPDAQRLVALSLRSGEAAAEGRSSRWSYPEFAAVRSSAVSFSHLAAYFADDVNLSAGNAAPERVRAEMVSASYFPSLGVQAAVGRTFMMEEDSIPGMHPVVILSSELWTRALGADPQAIGSRVVLNGVPLSIVGVMPAGFRGLTGSADVWIPQAMAPAVYYSEQLTSTQRFLTVVGRLSPGVELQRAKAELSTTGARAAAAAREAAGADPGAWTPNVELLDDVRRDPATVRAQLVLSGAVFFVLLIAAVNLSGLFLARVIGRLRELAVRTALGAGRRRQLQQAVVESVLVGAIGGALGVVLAAAGLWFLGVYAPERFGGVQPLGSQLATFSSPGLDWRVILFGVLLSMIAALVAGLIPAFWGTRRDLTRALRTGARGSSVGVGSLRRPTVLSAVAVVQMAFALVLLTGAGLLLRSFHELRSVDTGIDAAGVVSFRVSAPEGSYGGAAAAELLEQLLAGIEAVPGVESATVGRCLMSGDCSSTYLYVPGRPEDDAPIVGRHYVAPDHLRTLGIPLLRGRSLTSSDRAGAPRVALVSETAARLLWPGEDPIGKRVWFGSGGGFASPDSLTEIVGVVADVRYAAPGEDPVPDVYTSYLQFTFPETMVMVRAAADPVGLEPALRRAVAAVDPALPIYDVRTVSDRASAAIAAERFATMSLGVLATLGVLLAALGVYGVMAYSVIQRRRELGIRLALGATPAGIQRLVIGHGLALAVAGLLAGVLLSRGVGGALSALIAGTCASDPMVLATVAALLLFVVLITCYLPARTAARTDPVQTLASE